MRSVDMGYGCSAIEMFYLGRVSDNSVLVSSTNFEKQHKQYETDRFFTFDECFIQEK